MQKDEYQLFLSWPQEICASGLISNGQGIWGDSCVGDSGGPLTWTDLVTDTTYLIGVVSHGDGCGRSKNDTDGDEIPTPGFYARVSDSEALKWISDCISRGECGDPLLN